MRLAILGTCLVAALCAGGCATRPTVYKAPDNSKVAATTKRLSVAIDRENETWNRAETKVQAAQQSYDRIAGHSASVLQLIKELEPFIPADQKPKFDELKESADAQIVEEGKLSVAITGASGEIEQGKKDHAVVAKERDQLKEDQASYQQAAGKLAESATAESATKSAQIDALKKQLTSQKIFGWLWKIGGALAILSIVAGFILYITGKLGLIGAKIAAKF